MSKISKDEYAKYSSLVTKATQKWEIAKNKEDYSLFKDYLQDLIDTNKKFILYRGYKKKSLWCPIRWLWNKFNSRKSR